MKKLITLLLALSFVFMLAACGGGASAPTPAAEPAAATPAAAPADAAPADTAPADAAPAEDSFVVGICQLVQHPALDAATEGFKAALTEKLGDKVSFVEQNASGDSALCSTICGQFVAEEVDLIMANATPALQAAASATATDGDRIPVLATSITDFGSALGIDNWSGVTGTNISGTSDLAPLDGQAEIIRELFPEAKTVGILYCDGEANSLFQVNTIRPILEGLGFEVKTFSFSESSQVSSAAENACSECEVLYIPTDNTCASCGEAIHNAALNAGTPIVAGEENLCKLCGVATLSINYHDIGFACGEMAAEILTGGADVSTMPVRYAPQFTKEFNAELCQALGVTVPEDFVAIA